jgi:hypothetical protein
MLRPRTIATLNRLIKAFQLRSRPFPVTICSCKEGSPPGLDNFPYGAYILPPSSCLMNLIDAKLANESIMSSYVLSLLDISRCRRPCNSGQDFLPTGAGLCWKRLKPRLAMRACCRTEQQHDDPIGLSRGQLATGRGT